MIGQEYEAMETSNFEEKIEFTVLRSVLAKYCYSEQGVFRSKSFTFSTDSAEIERQLDETEEFLQLLRNGTQVPQEGYDDVRCFLHKMTATGGFLSVEELYVLICSYKTIETYRLIIDKQQQNAPRLLALVSQFVFHQTIIKQLDVLLDEKGEVRDNASPELKKLRSRIRSRQGRMEQVMERTLRVAREKSWLGGESVHMRDGLLTLPVVKAFKNQVAGVIVDESSSGNTVYIEPLEAVAIRNELKSLELEERREIIRLLKKANEELKPYATDINAAYEFLEEIDFIQAKARFAREYSCVKPLLSQEPTIKWENAFHPILRKRLEESGGAMVPFSFSLDNEVRILLISGPNAGGKSVCLKSVGLIQYMLQCGLLVPLDKDSLCGTFQTFFIDIGDEQSIEDDLSTYSSHLQQMKHMISQATEQSLLLIDEIGTGTEPIIGASIAQSVMKSLHQKKVRGVITTHYASLKEFAMHTLGIENGAMVFDEETMTPLYRLSIGHPGNSYALEIAENIGLPKEILDDVKAQSGKEALTLQESIKVIERSKNESLKKEQKILEKERQLEATIQKYQQKLQDITAKEKSIVAHAQSEASSMLHGANKLIENTIREIKQSNANKAKTTELRQNITTQKKELAQKKSISYREKELKALELSRPSSSSPKKEKRTLENGDFVRAKSGFIGEIIEMKKGKAVVVQGAIKATFSLSELVYTAPLKPKQKRSIYSPRKDLYREKLNFSTQLDIMGYRGEEAIEETKHYVDKAILLGVKQVRVLHGTGNGILRSLVAKYLASEPAVSSFEHEQPERGGTGITIVNIF